MKIFHPPERSSHWFVKIVMQFVSERFWTRKKHKRLVRAMTHIMHLFLILDIIFYCSIVNLKINGIWHCKNQLAPFYHECTLVLGSNSSFSRYSANVQYQQRCDDLNKNLSVFSCNFLQCLQFFATFIALTPTAWYLWAVCICLQKCCQFVTSGR